MRVSKWVIPIIISIIVIDILRIFNENRRRKIRFKMRVKMVPFVVTIHQRVGT